MWTVFTHFTFFDCVLLALEKPLGHS